MATLASLDLRDELLEEFRARLEALKYSPHTRRGYLRVARGFLTAYPDVPFERITPEHVERCFFGRPVSPRTISTDLENLRPFFKWLHRHKRLLRSNPCDGVERPRWKARLRPAPTWDEFCALRKHCQTLEEAALLEVFYFTGLRRLTCSICLLIHRPTGMPTTTARSAAIESGANCLHSSEGAKPSTSSRTGEGTIAAITTAATVTHAATTPVRRASRFTAAGILGTPPTPSKASPLGGPLVRSGLSAHRPTIGCSLAVVADLVQVETDGD